MLINLTDVLTSEDRVMEMQVETGITELAGSTGSIPVAEKTPLTLTIANLEKNKASLRGRMELSLIMNCDRCLKPVRQRIALDFTGTVYGPDAQRSGAETDEEELDFMEGYQLDADGLIRNECFLNLPMKVLCRPDCRGICAKCGKDLNTGECGCDTFVPDPRMAGIKDIFEANKEV